MGRELLDVLGHSDQHDGGTGVVASLDQALHNDIGVEQHETSPQLLRQRQLLALQILVGTEEQLVRLLVIAHLLLLLGDDVSRACGLHVVAQRFVQSVDIVGILRHVILLAHQVVDQRVRQRVTSRFAHDLDGVVDFLLAHLQVQLQSRGVLLAERVVPCGVGQEVALLVVLGDSAVLIARAVVAQARFEGGHLVLPLCQQEGLLVVLGEQQEFDCPGDVAVLPAVFRHPLRAGGELCLAHQLEGLLRLVQAVQADSDHAVQVSSPLVRDQCVLVSATRLLGLRELQMQLRRGDLGHERRRRLEVHVQDVQGGRLVVRARGLIELRRLHVLLHLFEHFRALAQEDWIIQIQRHLHAPRQIAEPHRAAGDTRLAMHLMGRSRSGDVVAHGHLVVAQSLLILVFALQLHGTL
mmetsp:Transcript_45687/g.108614  ORF Transcript_45687/g.108614 Transcript_45687/m.108614 type:complete len:410 (+) Transcript_45687:546-1775(+)